MSSTQKESESIISKVSKQRPKDADATDTGRAIFAEFLGSFAFVLIGALVLQTNGPTAVALGLGNFTAAAVAYGITIWTSEGDITPGTSIMQWLMGRRSWRRMVGFIVAQFIGALAAGALVLWIGGCAQYGIGGTSGDVVGVPQIPSGVVWHRAFAAEMVFSGLAFLAYLVVIDDARNKRRGSKKGAGEERTMSEEAFYSSETVKAILVASLAFGAAGFAAGTVSTASLDPWRHMGTAIPGIACAKVTQTFRPSVWIFYVAPVVGRVFFGGVYYLIMNGAFATVVTIFNKRLVRRSNTNY